MFLIPAQEAWPILLGLEFSDVIRRITDTVPITPSNHDLHVLN
jgi:hypothetical protein